MIPHHKKYSYVIITPARNEEAYIEKTVQSVISQTILPKKWVVVSDGSTDRTDEIVNRYIKKYNWIQLLRMPEHKEHNFAAKAYCFNAGYQTVKDIDIDFDVIGNLDADISFEKDYFEFLLGKLSQIPELGVAGTRFFENDYSTFTYSSQDVSGQCQLFRRECLEEIGGYFPSRYGGIDWIAVKTARMKGWKTRTFSEKTFYHYRSMGAGESNKLAARLISGRKDYLLGNHPLWELFRIIFQITKKPYVIRGMLLLSGYTWAFLSRMERPISQELINFHRKEQMNRLKTFFHNLLKLEISIGGNNDC